MQTSRKLPEWLDEPADRKEMYEKALKELVEQIGNWFDDEEKSAESATLSQLEDKKMKFYFLASDSLSTLVVAEVLKRYYQKVSPSVRISTEVIADLTMKNKKSFEKGIDNLIMKVLEILRKEKDVVFNITAGYKGVIPYFSTIAQIFDARLIYDFEGVENRLITIEPLPIEFDRSFFELLYPYLYEEKFEDPKIFSFLRDLRIVTANKSLTPLGYLIRYATERYMMNKSALGHFVEYLLYAELVQKREPFRDFRFRNIEIGKRFFNDDKSNTLTDADIYMENDNEIFWLEVKPISYFMKVSELKKQFFQKQFRIIKKLKKPLYRYGVVFYGIDKNGPKPRKAIKNFANMLKARGISSGFYYLPLSLKIRKKLLSPQNFQSLTHKVKIEEIETIFEKD
jgi:hypothetical protein